MLINSQLKVVDPDTSRILGTNQVGELLWKTKTTMNCYYNDPDATAATIDEEGWMHSGDFGYYNEGGEIFVTDRMKELIIRLPHPVDDEDPVTSVVRTESFVTEIEYGYFICEILWVTEQELIDLVATEMVDNKRLRGGVRFMDHLPKIPSNKIQDRYMCIGEVYDIKVKVTYQFSHLQDQLS
ncbi:luciferin 4-monooxygenase-like [Diprion similis]|uniref:luciferin 4-monooxygenase-like n=1 Tax=Diprion similis TaxID=362088 RepID=UPI001EF7B290|nr:luciferin 4-monooxygenase-like [Diprion similis]